MEKTPSSQDDALRIPRKDSPTSNLFGGGKRKKNTGEEEEKE